MDKRSRAYRLFTHGLDAVAQGSPLAPSELTMLMAVAAMVDEATKKPTPRKKDVAPLGFDVADMLMALGVDVTNVPGPAFGQLGSMARSLGVTADDIPKLESFVGRGGLDWYAENNIAITTAVVRKNLSRWIEQARSVDNSTAPAQATTAGFR